jgi:hypothetical protein
MTTLEELDAALLALPTNPVTDEDFTKRRELMTRRIELYNSIHNPPLEQQQATQHAGGLVEVIIPPGGPGAFAKKVAAITTPQKKTAAWSRCFHGRRSTRSPLESIAAQVPTAECGWITTRTWSTACRKILRRLHRRPIKNREDEFNG